MWTEDEHGNVSPVGPRHSFRAVWDDGFNHGAADASKVCGFSSPSGAGSTIWLFLAVAIFAAARRVGPPM